MLSRVAQLWKAFSLTFCCCLWLRPLVLAKGKTSEAIAKLMDLAPDMATLLTLDSHGNVVSERTIISQLIQRNDIIRILPGEKVIEVPSVILVDFEEKFPDSAIANYVRS